MVFFRSIRPRPGRVVRWAFPALLLLAPAASALNPTRAITQYVHDSWQIDEGLPQNTVRAIVQGPDGYLWLAGQEGLIRFDGVSFTVYDQARVPELRSNNLLALLLARDGSLWIGTESGLTRMKDRRFSIPAELSSENVKALAEGPDGVLWVGTDGRGLKRLEGDAVRSFTTSEGLPSNSVSALLADADGALWVGTRGGGLCRFSGERCTVYGVQDGLPNEYILALHQDPKGTLWVGTRKGLYRREGKRFVADGPTENVGALRTDRDGNLWVGTYGAGLARKTAYGTAFYSTGEGLTDNVVRAIYEDREGSLWIGTEGGGLNRLRNGRLLTYSMAEGLKANNIWPILQDHTGAVWIGTAGGGLFRFEKERFTQYTTNDGLSDAVVSSLFEDHEGTLWVGTKAGLNRFRDGKFTALTTRNGLSNDFVWAITEDRDGSLWIGTAGGGLNHWKDEKFSIPLQEGLPQSSVIALHQDRAGRLWIGTAGGLSRLDPGQQRPITLSEDQGVPPKPISSFYEDGEGTLWIGTQGAGLIRFKDGHFKTITTAQGLYNDVSFRVLEDGAGNLWISCNKGLFRVSKHQLNDVAEGRAQRVDSVSFGREDGMLAAECNGTFQPSGWATRDGRLWFPTVKGVVVVDPTLLPTNEVIPPVVIDRLVVDNVDVDPTVPLTLKPGTKSLAVHYAGLSLVAPKKVMFRFQLEGFDADWVEAGTRRVAYYNNLAPGQYQFRVIASNNDGLWNNEGVSLTLTQLPYFYQTRWFLALSVLAGGLALAAGYRLRLNQVERSHRRDLDRLELQKEMELTAAVQAFFLPRLGFFGDGRVQLKGFYRPAAKCGGDWWWYDAGHGKKISVMVGDVTGHGVASAMITAVVAGGLYALQHGGPERELRSTLHELNQELLDLCSGEYHMTLSAAQLDPATGELEWWNAGGPPLLLIRREGTILPIASVGSPLGSNDFLVTPVRLSLRRGDRVLLFTDGMPELELPGGKQLGMRRLCRILEQTYRLPLEEATQAIVNELDLARMSQPQTDDLAFALLEMTEEPLVTAMPLSEHAASNTHN